MGNARRAGDYATRKAAAIAAKNSTYQRYRYLEDAAAFRQERAQEADKVRSVLTMHHMLMRATGK